jgi:SsrA-binding protein
MSAKSSKFVNGVVTRNRKAFHEYEVLEQLECGVILYGSEVKSIRNGKIQIDDAYAVLKNDEIWIVGINIGEYPQANLMNHMPLRERKLLIHKREMLKLVLRMKDRGTTLVPTDVHFNERGIVKIMLGIAKGRREYDKREKLKKDTARKEISQAMKKYRS